ncbi:MAG: Rdx family protein [Candidatus Limnocylindria bacterium]
MTITYCAECGYESETVGLARALMEEFGQRLSSIEIIPWEEGTFDVSVDGELVHSMAREGGFPDPETVKGAIRRRPLS